MTTKKLKILLIEDNPGDATLIEVMLAETGSLLFSLEHAAFLYDGIELLEKKTFDVVLLDIGLPDSTGLDSIIEVINKAPDTPVVMMTGLDDEETAISALRMGAQDYLVKGQIDSGALLRSVRYAVERKRVEENLWSSRQFIQRVTEATPNIIYVFDLTANRVVYVNHTLRDMLGYDVEDIEEMGPHLYERLLHPDEIVHLPELIKRYYTAGDGAIIETELRVRHADGQWRWLTTRDVVFTRTAEGRPRQILGTAQDITERKYMEEAVRHFAYHDALTSLPNRRLLTDRIRLALTQASRDGHRAAVLCMDLDNFKGINDSFGHEAGDSVLREVARRLKGCLRESDTVARTGGDEFVIVLHKTTHEADAAIIAEKIISSLRAPFHISGHALNCTTSVGISLYPIDGYDAETLLRNADIALYKAKEKGKNHFQFYANTMNDRVSERKKLENLLREAYEKGEFVLHYQPQLKLHSRQVTCAEALLRWQNPADGLHLPEQFIPLAEETGLITALDEWALRAACLQNKAWQDAGHRPLCVAVNLSSRLIRQPQIVETVSRVLNETGLGPAHLGLDISECPASKDIDHVASILMRLEALGVQIFMDDFGKGSASISHLLKWPLRAVKIDKSYIGNISSDPDYGSVVHSLVDMAHQLDINVVAEGVETEKQLAFLKAARCDDVQGYLFSRPLPAEEFVKFIN